MRQFQTEFTLNSAESAKCAIYAKILMNLTGNWRNRTTWEGQQFKGMTN